jgi:hypothetical protein
MRKIIGEEEENIGERRWNRKARGERITRIRKQRNRRIKMEKGGKVER